MLTLRRLQASKCTPLLARTNATLEVAKSSTPPPPPPAQTATAKAETTASVPPTKNAGSSSTAEASPAGEVTQGRRRRFKTHRPSITLERPRQYMRPLGRGVLPVYDLAVNYIKQDSVNLKQELDGLKAKLETGKLSPEKAERVKEKIGILEVQSEINLPSVRWKARNGLGMRSVALNWRILTNATQRTCPNPCTVIYWNSGGAKMAHWTYWCV